MRNHLVSLCLLAAAPAACGSVTPHPGDDDGVDGAATIDAPTTPTDGPDDGPGGGDTNPPQTTLDMTPPLASADPVARFGFASSEANSTFRCKLDTATEFTCTTPYTTATLANGAHTFEVAAVDPAGNVDPTAAIFAWNIDTAAPSIAIASGPSPGAATNDATPTWTFTVVGATAITCAIDGGTAAACTTTFTSASLADGPHGFTIRATDDVGNGSMGQVDFTVDTVVPTVLITGQPADPTNLTGGTVAWTSSETAAFSCKLDTAAAAACGSGTSGSRALSGLAPGSHTLAVIATDAAGNPRTANATWVIDTTPPTVTIDSGPGAATNDTTPTFTFTAAGASAVTCAIDGVNFTACTSTFTSGTLAQGAHSFTVRAVDAAGNPAMASSNFTVDSVLPVVTITGRPADPTRLTGGTVTWTSSETASFTCRIDITTPVACGSGTSGSRALSGLSAGTHTFTITATDAATNPGTQSATWTIDLTPPTVTLVGNPPYNYTTTITFNFNGNETADFDCTVLNSVGTRVDGPRSCGSGTSGSVTYGGTLPLAQDLELDVTATDRAGNVGGPLQHFFCRGSTTACSPAN